MCIIQYPPQGPSLLYNNFQRNQGKGFTAIMPPKCQWVYPEIIAADFPKIYSMLYIRERSNNKLRR